MYMFFFSILQKGIVYGHWTGRHQPLRIDTSSQNLPFTMNVRLTANYFHPLKKETEEMSGNRECIDPQKILKIRKDKNCTDNCIPTIFSSLFDASIFKECPDFDSHFCALEELFSYVYEQAYQCTNSGVEKYFEGTLAVGNGISQTDFLNHNTS